MLLTTGQKRYNEKSVTQNEYIISVLYFWVLYKATGNAHLKKGNVLFWHRKESDIIRWILAPPLVSLTKNMHLSLKV